MPTPRVLLGMTLGAVVAALGALFLGEYEFDELLPILSGALLGLIVAEVVVSVGKLRALPLALLVAAWSATAVVLAGMLDSNETEPVKSGAYLSAGLAALAALARANDWKRKPKASRAEDVSARADTHAGTVAGEPVAEAAAPASRRPRPTPAPVGRGDDRRSGRPAQPSRQTQPSREVQPSRPARRRPAPIADEEWMEEPPPPVASRPRQRRPRDAEDAPPAIPTGPVRARPSSSRRLDAPAEPRREAGTAPRRPRPQPEETRVRATPRRRPRTDRDR